MNTLKKILHYLFLSGVYFIALYEFFISLIFMPLFKSQPIVSEYGNAKIIWVVYILTIVLVISSGIYAFVSLRKQDRLYKIFGFKISTALITVLGTILPAAIYLYVSRHSVGIDPRSMTTVPITFASIFFWVIFLYPFFALLEYIFRNKYFRIWIVTLAIMVNPGFVMWSMAYYAGLSYMTYTYPCGVKVTGFSSDSPTVNAGMTAGEVIIRINDEEINTVDEFLKFVGSLETAEDIIIYTNDGEYVVKPKYDEVRKKYLIGVHFAYERCEYKR